MSQLCDSIQCRLTARTAGSTKGEILASELEKKQRDGVKKDINLPHTNHSVSGATTCYLLYNNNTFRGKAAVARR